MQVIILSGVPLPSQRLGAGPGISVQPELPDETDTRHLEEVKNCPRQLGLRLLALQGRGTEAGSYQVASSGKGALARPHLPGST